MRRADLDLRVPLSLPGLVLAGVGASLLALGCGSASSSVSTSTSAAQVAPSGGSQTAGYQSAGLLTPIRPAPPLSLRNYLGQRIDIAAYKGKAVLVTFLYTHCPDVCPLIASQLRVAQNLLGPAASKVQIIAVSVDARGDTPKAVAAFLARRQMTGRMQYLLGSTHELAATWSAWGVGSERDAQKPEFINHSGLIFGVTGSGKRVTIYASSFKPAEVAHDVALLAAR